MARLGFRAGFMAGLAGLVPELLALFFANHFLFGTFSVVNLLQPTFFYFYPRTVQLELLGLGLDRFVWGVSVIALALLTPLMRRAPRTRLVSFPIAVATIVAAFALLLTSPNSEASSILTWTLFVAPAGLFVLEIHSARPRAAFIWSTLIFLLSYVVMVETAASIHWILKAFDFTTQIGAVDAAIELKLSYISYGFLPWEYAAFLFSWLWIPVAAKAIGKFRHSKDSPLVNSKNPDDEPAVQEGFVQRAWAFLDPKLLLALAVVVFVSYYPYFENPPWLVGTDAYWRYYDPLLTMNSRSFVGGFLAALDERHPAPLIILYAFQKAFAATPFEVVRLTPLALTASLGMLTWAFLFPKRGSLGLTVLLFSAMSVTTTVGLYSSILANWMTLVAWVGFFAYACSRLDRGLKTLDLAVLLSISTLILFLHPWTWGVFAASMILVAASSLRPRKEALRNGGLLLGIILTNILVAVASLTLLSGSEGWRVADAIEIYMWWARNPTSLFWFWDALSRLTQVWAPFFSPLLIAASIIGVASLPKAGISRWRRRFVWAWVIAAGLGSLFVAPYGFDPADPTGSESQLWRLFFLTPFAVTTPLGVAALRRYLAGHGGPETETRKAPTQVMGLILAAGSTLPFATAPLRAVLIFLFLAAFLAMRRFFGSNSDNRLLGQMVVLVFLLVAFTSTTRALSQLLLAPHNYRP